MSMRRQAAEAARRATQGIKQAPEKTINTGKSEILNGVDLSSEEDEEI